MSAPVTVASLRHRLVLEEPVDTPDGAGGFSREWREVDTLWVAMEHVAARTTSVADRTAHRITHRITLRYRADVTSGHRFRDGTRIFGIRSVYDPHATRRVLIAETEEMTP